MTTRPACPSGARRTPARAPGFSLIELMVALAVMSLVLVAVFATFFRSQHAGQTMMDNVNLRQSARGAVQLLERELRMAGSGWGRLPVYGWYGTAAETLYAINPGPGAGTSCDSVRILGGWSAATTLSDSMPTSASPVKVASVFGFSVGDLFVVTNLQRAHMFQVTGVMSSPAQLQHATSSPFNTTSALTAWPASGYGRGSNVYRASWVSYRVDSTSFRRPALVRWEAGALAQLVAYDVTQFQVRYRLQDSTYTRKPDDFSMIDDVIPVVHTRLSFPGRAALTDSAWASVRPRTF